MAEKKRLLVTVGDRGRRACERLAAASGKPLATVVGELVDEAAPMLEALASSMEAMREKKGDAYRAVSLALAKTQLSAAQLAVDLHGVKGMKGRK